MEKEELIRQLMREHGGFVIRTAFLYVKDKMTAEDIAQEVFLRAFHKIEDFRGGASVQTWLYRITVNLCKDYIKSWAYRKLQFTNQFDSERSHTGLPEKLYAEKSQAQTLLEKVIELPVKYREVIVMHYFDDLKTKEISELLDLKESTVRVRLSRALKKLRLDFVEEGVLWTI